MPSKLPPLPLRSSHVIKHGKAAETSAQTSPSMAETAPRLTETFRKRRGAVWAIGVAVIVISGVCIGAYYKGHEQAQDRFTTWEQKAGEVVGDIHVTAQSLDPSSEATPKSQLARTPPNITNPTIPSLSGGRQIDSNSSLRGMSNDHRQIMYLSDRRGELMKQKFDLERKIERVREKKKREEELEARRPTGVGGDR